jgi:uncharacterized protein YjlB
MKVLLALVAVGWLCSRWCGEALWRAGNHALLVTVAASFLPHGMKILFDQTCPDRRTVIGHVHGISFSGKREDAFPSGHALQMGALASAAGTLQPGPRRTIQALAVGLSPTATSWQDSRLERSLRSSCDCGPVIRSKHQRRTIMPILEDLKEYAEFATGLRRPGKRKVSHLARARKAHAVRFKDDGLVPNHPRWPLIIYRGAVDLDERHDPAAVIEDLFEANGWGGTWRDGIYDYVHYHSRIHEVLGIARGKGRVRFGGKEGRIFTLKAGDVAVLPAGTGHQCLSADDDFLVVGAYPAAGTYDECMTVEDRPRALKTIPKVPPARKDPVYGTGGSLSKLWKKAK